jgi:methionine-rich copper-binding protein CopC
MNKSTFADHNRLSKTFIACLIISLMVLAPLAPLSMASPRPSRAAEAARTIESTAPAVPAPPMVPSITATKTDSFPDPDMDGKAAPGETITYDVNINNGGTDAADVNFNDTIDTNTTLIGGSLKVSPLAYADTYFAAKDTQLSVGAPGVLTNDTGLPAPTAVAIAGGPTTQGGSVTLSADGSFIYNPASGFTGTDTFTYTVTNGLTPNDTAQVTITVDAPPSVTATTPVNGATNQALNSNISITFSEPVDVTGNWFQVVCTTSGTRNVADTVVTGGPTTFTINPNVDFTSNETCTVTVFAAQVSDQDTNDPPDNMTADFVFSFGTADTAPTVTNTTPTNGATNQTTNTNITVTFSEPVNVAGNWFQIVCGSSGTRNVADTVVTGGPSVFTINPNVDFSAGETCTVTVFAAQVTDQDAIDPPDNMAANFVFSFTTETAPSVTATTPTNGATVVPNNTNISVTFSEPVDVTGNWFQIVGATSGTRNVADTVVTGGPTTFTINPNVDFANGELVTVTIFAAQVSDQDTGDPPDNMAANFVFSFTIDQAPSVTATTPTNGATNQSLNQNVSITFSEPVNVAGNWFQISCTTSGVRNVADTVVTGGSTTFTINPNADFTTSETCTVTVFAAQVTDQDAGDPPDNMTANFVFSFQTIDAAPTVTNVTPTNGAINQPTNTDLTVTFSEPVNVGATWFTIACPTSGARNVAATVVTGGPTTFTINPNVDFAPGETCTVTIAAAQVTDQDANDPPDQMAANFVWSFTMDAAPSVTSTIPTNGATQVANNTNISLTFSEPVNVTGNWFQIVGATSGTRNPADTVVTGGPTTFSINPNVDFANGELVTVTVFAAQVTDQDSNDPPDNMLANFVFSFTIDVPPTVTSTVPTNGTINVPKASNIVINFSENVTATTSSFTIECPTPGNLQGFAVSGSNSNQITLNPTSDLPVGVICTVTVIANQISDADSGDPPDNMDANFVFSFGVQPEAVDDARNATGNIQIQTAGRSDFSVKTNDIPAATLSVTAFDATSVRGGTVSVAADGRFSYNPPAGYEGTDSFNYTVSNAAGSDVGTVVITITGMIWFVNNSAGACTTINGSCGRLTNPLSTLAAFETANGNATPIVNGDVTSPEAGDHLFIYTGGGSYNSSLTLENTQRVIGQGAASTLSSLSGITPATDSDALPATGGTNPVITNSGGNGIVLAQNNRLHGLTVQNTTGTGISGNGFGTLTVSENVIVSNTTTAGTAVSFTSGTLAATFRSITAGNNDGNPDPANGIVLITTTGTFTVDGDGSNAAVGGNSSGGVIQNVVGADGANGGNAVFMSGATGVTLRRMTISGTNQNHGIRGVNTSNFTMEFSTVTGTNGNSVALDEGSVNFDNLTGTAAITSCVIEGGFEDNLNVVNTSGSLNRLVISGTTFGFNNTANGNNNILIESNNPGTTLNFTVKSSLIKGARADWININTLNNSTMDALIGGPVLADGNTFDNLGANAHAGAAAGGNRVVTGSVGSQTVDIRNNTFKGSKGEAIRLRGTANGAVTGTVNGRIRNNTIGVAGTANSGSSEGAGIFIFGDGGSDMNVAITNNGIFQYNNNGILLQFGDEINDGSVFNATVTSNTISNPGNLNTDFNGIQLNNGTVGATDNFTSCVDIGGAGVGNTVSNSGSGVTPPNNADIRLRQRQSTTVRLPGYGGANNNDAAVVTYLTGRNTLVTAAASNTVPTGGGFVGGAACTQPSFALLRPEVRTDRDNLARTKTPSRSTETTKISSTSTETKPVASQTVSHHAKLTKRNVVAPVSNAVRNTAVTSATVATPAINKTVSRQQVNATQDKKPRGGVVVKPRASNLGGETINHSVGTLLAGKTVHIQFQVTVNNPYLGGATVSNQGTVSGSNFSNVLTDDPAVGGANDPTLTPILLTPNVSVTDAQANEPAAGSAPMIFTVALSSPAPASGASVHYETADQAPAPNHAVAGVDYTAIPDTVLNFAAGEQFKTISVDILADGGGPEVDETFLLNLSNPTNAIVVDGQGVGTIKQGNAAGTFLISELRTSGPGGAGDDFVEVYNNTDTPLTIAASDASAGYGLFKMGADCNATPVLIGTIPNGTVIPARGHYLFVGSAYSLANYGGTGAAAGDQTLSSDIESDRNVGIFTTATVTNISSATRLDAVGFGSNTGGTCDLLREGATLTPLSGSVLQYSYVRDECGKKGNPAMFGICPTGGGVKDTNVNSDDFIFVDTTAAATPAGQRLGAPGPQNLTAPLLRNSTITTLLLDSNIGAPAPPNRVRDLTPMLPNAANGTLSVRRRFVNNTGASVTRLRFRIVDISSISVPAGIADMRALSSLSVVVSGITDTATCLAANGVPTTPCTVTVQGTTLETPPAQPLGGAHNSTMSAGTITLATPLAAGASINLQFLLGVQQTGSFKFFFNIEALP